MNVNVRHPPSIEAIDALLPQTQCRQCGHPGCRPYAAAIAAGHAAINRCAPGGEETIRELAQLLRVPVQALDPAFGVTKPPIVAIIDEALCIGCTLCIQACPVDAITGATRLMHTVIAAECTGCELCIAPCPVNCIVMIETAGAELARKTRAERARRRYTARCARLEAEKAQRATRLGIRDEADESRKRATIERVMKRARQRLERRD